MLRVHELLVFEGNNIDSDNYFSTTSPTVTSVVLSSGQIVTVSDQDKPGPNLRFEIDPSIPNIEERYALENLIFENVNLKSLESTSIQACLHSIETGICFSCLPGFMLSADGTGCTSCSVPNRYFPPFDICGSFLSNTSNLSASKINKFSITQSGVDPFNLGLPVSKVNSVFGYLTIMPPYSVSSLNDQTVFSLSDDLIHVLEVEIYFDFTDEQFMGNASYGVNFFSSVNGAEILHYLIDRNYKTFVNTKRQRFYTIISSDSSDDYFENLSFFFAHDSSSNSSLNSSLPNYIFDYKYSVENVLNQIPSHSSIPEIKIHPVSLLLNPDPNKTFVYSPFSLSKYYAADISLLLDPPEGFYYETTSNFKFLRSCRDFCIKCKSASNCTECKEGFFLKGFECLPCALTCSGCETLEDNCLTSESPVLLPGIVLADDTDCGASKYFDLATQKCEGCPANCYKCGSSSTCVMCHSHFILDKEKCVHIDPCNLPSEKSDTNIKLFSCVKCSKNCLYCDQNKKNCSICKNKFYLDKLTCQSCQENCDLCLNKESCLRCSHGFEIKNDLCVKIEANQQDKIIKSSNNVKVFLTPNLQVNIFSSLAGILSKKEKEKTIDNCHLSFLNKNNCFLCQKGFYLSPDYKCNACSQNCVFCTSPKFCTKCKTGYGIYFDQIKDEVGCVNKKVLD